MVARGPRKWYAVRTVADALVQIRRPRPETGGPRVYIETYGCQMNVADSDLMRGLLGDRGYVATADAGCADVILINTCAVREKAEERVLARAAELKAHKRRRPGVVLGITGCMAEHLRGKLLERAPWLDVVAGPDSYRRLPALVEEARAGHTAVDLQLDKAETYEGLDTAPGGDGVSGFVTIQRGCDKFCTFCVVPFTRGRERGTPPREILRQVRALAAAGYREVTLLGQTVNSYRHEEAGFAALLRAVAAVDGIARIRFTSPYPIDFTPDVIGAIAEEPKVAKHVHLPLQSASDAVLARMRRGYDVAAYVEIVAALRRAVPGIALTTDILVGFSGETDADHAATLEAMRTVDFDAAFTFAYSEREGTQAARRLPDDVPDALKKARLAEVIALQERISAAKNAAYVGRIEEVLLHAPSKRSPDELVGRTDTFKAVVVPRAGRAPGELVRVAIERATSATLFGKIAGPAA
jgi:tRNA-2-methylthio-N6-dimethylallyladenosine synthase